MAYSLKYIDEAETHLRPLSCQDRTLVELWLSPAPKCLVTVEVSCPTESAALSARWHTAARGGAKGRFTKVAKPKKAPPYIQL